MPNKFRNQFVATPAAPNLAKTASVIAVSAKMSFMDIMEANSPKSAEAGFFSFKGNIVPPILPSACFHLLFTGEGRDMAASGVPASPDARRGRVAPGGWQAAPRQASLAQ